MSDLDANSVDPDQTPHSAVSDLGLYCLQMPILRDARLKWVKFKGNSRQTLFLHKSVYCNIIEFCDFNAYVEPIFSLCCKFQIIILKTVGGVADT